MKLKLASLALLALSTAAQAEEFNTIRSDRSNVAFTFKQMGVPVDGRFAKFSAQLKFDPAKPAGASASIDIDLASIDAGSAEANDEVAGRQWFNTKAFPTARFVASAIRPLGGNRYEAAGKMTIKGRTQDVVAPFTFVAQGKTAAADGSFVLKRADYAIGEGAWADFGTIANEIQIKFHLQAEAAPVGK
jgi:polyisoprenoid-binding protein YceI